MKYSETHVQHLLNGLDRYDRYRQDPTTSEVVGEMRGALRSGKHQKYQTLARKYNIVLCELCHTPTSNTGSMRCDMCWELEHRILPSRLALWGATPEGRKVLLVAQEAVSQAMLSRLGLEE
jgi:hypothetical protein